MSSEEMNAAETLAKAILDFAARANLQVELAEHLGPEHRAQMLAMYERAEQH